jgi:type II secretory pathway component GspD/PulD (secretin)
VDDVAAFMRAIADVGSVRHIAAPQVLALNNEPAVMRVGSQEVAFQTRAPAGDADAASRTSEAHAITAGLTLTVTAQIAGDGIVLMSLAPTYAERTGEARAPGGDRVPVLSVSEADTLVRVQDGETVVIAGLLRERVQVKPAQGFGGLFGAQDRRTGYVELVVLLTPTVVTPGGASLAGER